MTLDCYLISHTKISLNGIKDLNMRHEIIKLLEENIGSNVLDVSLSNNFFLIYLQKQWQQKNRNRTKLTSVQQREKLT